MECPENPLFRIFRNSTHSFQQYTHWNINTQPRDLINTHYNPKYTLRKPGLPTVTPNPPNSYRVNNCKQVIVTHRVETLRDKRCSKTQIRYLPVFPFPTVLALCKRTHRLLSYSHFNPTFTCPHGCKPFLKSHLQEPEETDLLRI